jgi:hypothetical protein
MSNILLRAFAPGLLREDAVLKLANFEQLIVKLSNG